MILLLNYRTPNNRLREGLADAGHLVEENIWDFDEIIRKKIEAVVFEFKSIFKDKYRFIKLAIKVRRAGIPIITWNLDSPWNMGISRWKLELLLKSGVIDIYATNSLQHTGRNKCQNLYLPNAALVSQYNLAGRMIEDLRDPSLHKWDVSFIGNLNSDRYKEHTRRQEFLRELEMRLSLDGLSCNFIDSAGMKTNEQVEIIQRSAINLSCLSAADSTGEKSWGLPERCYGVPACGGFLIMDDRRHVKDDFVLGKEAVTYKDIDECLSKIRYFIKRHGKRREIAEMAHARVMRDHTYQERAKRLVETILEFKESRQEAKN